MTQRFEFRGVTYDVVDRADMTWMELDQLERLTGLTTSEMRDDHDGSWSRISCVTAWLSMRRVDPVGVVSWEDYFASPNKETRVLAPTPEEQAVEDTPPLSEVDGADPTESTDGPEPGSGTSDGST